MPEITIGKHKAKQTRSGLKILCACCHLPQASIKDNGTFVTLSHHDEPHTNGWSIEDIEELLAVMKQTRANMRGI